MLLFVFDGIKTHPTPWTRAFAHGRVVLRELLTSVALRPSVLLSLVCRTGRSLSVSTRVSALSPSQIIYVPSLLANIILYYIVRQRGPPRPVMASLLERACFIYLFIYFFYDEPYPARILIFDRNKKKPNPRWPRKGDLSNYKLSTRFLLPAQYADFHALITGRVLVLSHTTAADSSGFLTSFPTRSAASKFRIHRKMKMINRNTQYSEMSRIRIRIVNC